MLPLSKQNAYRERYKALRPGWRMSGDEFEALARKHIGPGARVLDLGCGRGGVMELFWKDVKLSVGLDPDHVSLVEHRIHIDTSAPSAGDPSTGSGRSLSGTTGSSAAQSKDAQVGMPLICGLGEALPFQNESFDLVIALWVLEHLARPEVVLSEIGRVLAPGGHLIFLTPNALHPLIRANRLSQMLPALQRLLIPRLYARAEADTFRVRYCANTPARLRAFAAAHGFHVASLRAIQDPTYLAFNDLFFQVSVLFERLLPEEWGVHVVGEWVRDRE
jgi:SAM-dependent methyltransferase